MTLTIYKAWSIKIVTTQVAHMCVYACYTHTDRQTD